MCLENSPVHARSVVLLLNTISGHISPHYHVVLDNYFTTVPHIRNVTIPKNWVDLVSISSESTSAADFNLSYQWFQENTHDMKDIRLALNFMKNTLETILNKEHNLSPTPKEDIIISNSTSHVDSLDPFSEVDKCTILDDTVASVKDGESSSIQIWLEFFMPLESAGLH